ncbi:MAG: hypothetical protein ACLFVU_10970, partial [Phycisphaerae bacterium]
EEHCQHESGSAVHQGLLVDQDVFPSRVSDTGNLVFQRSRDKDGNLPADRQEQAIPCYFAVQAKGLKRWSERQSGVAAGESAAPWCENGHFPVVVLSSVRLKGCYQGGSRLSVWAIVADLQAANNNSSRNIARRSFSRVSRETAAPDPCNVSAFQAEKQHPAEPRMSLSLALTRSTTRGALKVSQL